MSVDCPLNGLGWSGWSQRVGRWGWAGPALAAFALGAAVLLASDGASAAAAQPKFTGLLGPSPVLTVAVLAGMGLAALAFLMVSSFVKIAVVLSILRSALGLSQIPPTSVITGIALVLSLYVMAPTGRAMSVHLGPALEALSGPGDKRDTKARERLEKAADGLNRAKEPLRAFLSKHAHAEDVRLFHRLALRMNRSDKDYKVGKKSFMVLLPAFLTSELKEAFQIGFLLFIPFLVIDLLVANVLMALGMHMLSPTTISLPFKLLLFVMVDGWHLLTRALLMGYT